MRPGPVLAAAMLAAGAPAAAQDAALPAAVQGLWITGECTAPEAMLFATGRGWAVLPTGGQQRMWRIARTGTADDEDHTRLLLRATSSGLETREPPAKLADADLPGDSPATAFRRCPAIPAALSALHGEGLSFLAALDGIEAACAGGEAAVCLDAAWGWADVARDGVLTAAEIARLARGVAYVLMLSEGADAESIAAALGAGALGGVAIGWSLIASFDYDGSASLSKAELMQDRFPPPGLAGAVAAAAASTAGPAPRRAAWGGGARGARGEPREPARRAQGAARGTGAASGSARTLTASARWRIAAATRSRARPSWRGGWTARGARTASRRVAASARRLVPAVIVSGRSVFGRSVTQGTPRWLASSCTPPESVITTAARDTRARNAT